MPICPNLSKSRPGAYYLQTGQYYMIEDKTRLVYEISAERYEKLGTLFG